MFQTYDVRSRPEDGPPRLTRLRAALKDAGADAFLVPRTDMFRGENVAPCDERLEWLTGFTGSAGQAIVTAERAVVFVDSRYTLQVRTQVAASHFEFADLLKDNASDWLKAALPPKSVVAYDPWLHTGGEIEKLEKALSPDLRLTATDNLLDQVWTDRPPTGAGRVFVHPLEFAGEPHEAKRARLGEALKADDLDAAVLTLPESICWLLNIRGEDILNTPVVHGFAILDANGQVHLALRDPAQLTGELRAHLGDDVTIGRLDAFPEALAQLTGRVSLDEATAPVAISRALAKAEIVAKRDPVVVPKAVKNPIELSGARAAHLRDGAAMVEFLCWLDHKAPKGGLTEIDVAQHLETCRRSTNALKDISFETISGTGPHGAIVHYRVNTDTNMQVEPGHLLLVDSGGQYLDGTTDITRTIAVGPPPEEGRRLFTLVLKGMIAVSRLRWPAGLSGRDIDAAARMALWAEGFDYDHGTGHGIGAYLSVHEGPAGISRRSTEPLLPGMILSNEPGYYREGAFGIRIENLIAVEPATRPDGGDRDMLSFETLTLAPIDRNLIDVAALSAEELDWLNAYHDKVRSALIPLVSSEAADWLEATTAPLTL